MIVLPNTPPLPLAPQFNQSQFPTSLITERLALNGSIENNEIKDVVRYIINLENYIDNIFKLISSQQNTRDLEACVRASFTIPLCENVIPWSNFKLASVKSRSLDNAFKKLSFKNEKDEMDEIIQFQWYLSNEIETSLISLSLSYNILASNIINELISVDYTANKMEEINEKWKKCTNYYKKSISTLKFTENFTNYQHQNESIERKIKINPILIEFFKKISTCSLQLSILSKSLWIQRETPNPTNNNSTLTRISIYILDEVKSCQEILKSICTDMDNKYDMIHYKSDKWDEYLNLIKSYINAYAGMYLSIEYYQQNKLGHSIGLINFGLLNLQNKLPITKPKEIEKDSKTSKLKNKLNLNSKISNKIQTHKNESYIKNVESISVLNISKSNFNKSSTKLITKDLNYLFDELIKLNLKYTKENDNLKFDTIEDWFDISRDSKWPSGLKVPVISSSWVPSIFENQKVVGTGGYY